MNKKFDNRFVPTFVPKDFSWYERNGSPGMTRSNVKSFLRYRQPFSEFGNSKF